MKKLFALLAALTLVSAVFAQEDYKYGLGLRLSYGADIDFRMNLDQKHTVNLMLNFPHFNGTVLTGLFEWRWPVIQSGFSAYVGPGLHFGAFGFANDHTAFNFGIDLMLGLEYKFDAPVALSIDWKPAMEILTGDYWARWQSWGLYNFGLTIRYCF